jgi:hypothetical protein
MSELKPGDLCEIVDHPGWGAHLASRENIGTFVILIEQVIHPNDHPFWSPHWRVAGSTRRPSHKVLRKIEPPGLDVDEEEEIEV